MTGTTRGAKKRRRITQTDEFSDIKMKDDDDINAGEDSLEEDDVWNSFKEEYVEFVEQLPLSLHRSFALMRELDKQARNMELEIMPSIRTYTNNRQALRPYTVEHLPSMLDLPDDLEPKATTTVLEDDDASKRGSLRAHQLNRTTTPPNVILPRISSSAFELVRASEEKVNLAQSAYDTVDRHVRLLDQLIKEQETRLGIAPRISGFVVPPLQGRRNGARPQTAPIGPNTIEQEAATTALTSSRSHRRTGRSNRASEQTSSDAINVGGAGSINGRERNGLTQVDPITGLTAEGLPIDPHEPRYCFCGQVSYGEMIGCDSDDCEGEWFHLKCVGLSEAPKGKSKWYCNNCKEKQGTGVARGKG